MAKRSIVFALANPVPEIYPSAAEEAGAAIVSTGRSDFPNQVNNSLIFPAVFRGVLDARARSIPDALVLAAAHELAAHADDLGLTTTHILPPTALPAKALVKAGLIAPMPDERSEPKRKA